MKSASRYLLLLAFTVSLSASSMGCQTVGSVAKYAGMTQCDSCGDSCECGDGDCGSEFCNSYPRRWTKAWYEREVGSPAGSRQVYKAGLNWPPYPRPQGKGQHFSEKFHTAHFWPHPYNCQDRAYIKETSARQIANGWRDEGTLYSYHFNRDTNELTHTGRNHLRWILDWVPEQHRTIWIQKGINQKADEMMVASVKKSAEEIVASGNMPPIVLRTTLPSGRPAEDIDQIRQLELNSMPTPRINAASSTGGAAGGGGGSGGGGSGGGI